MSRTVALASLVASATIAASGCPEESSRDAGSLDAVAEGDDAESAAHDASAESSAPDGEGGAGSGAPITLVFEHASFTTERVCDLDGNGLADNALADMGTPLGDLLAGVLSSSLQSHMDDGRRLVLHIPWVDDADGPTDDDVVALVFRGVDEDDPPVLDDDFSGNEGFYIKASYLDGCGEPLHAFPGSSLEAGHFATAGGESVAELGDGVELNAAGARGTIASGGASARLHMCSYIRIDQLGGLDGQGHAGDLTGLETFLAGGEAFGLPMPGSNPDLDLDGDGLERFVTDEEDHITTCVDGDGQPLAQQGRDCWQAPEMADAYSLTFLMDGVSARFVGREPGWMEEAVGDCPGGPPDESLFDPR